MRRSSKEGKSTAAGTTIISTLAVNFVNMGLGLTTGILTARGLGPDARGILVALVVWFGTVASFSLLALDDGIVYTARGGAARASALRRALVPNALVQASVGALAMLAIALVIVLRREPDAWLAAVLLMSVIPMNNLTLLALGTLRAAGRFGSWNLVRLMPQSIYCLILLVLVSTGQLTVLSGIAALAVGNLGASVAAIALARRIADGDIKAESSDKPAAQTYGRKLFLAMVPAHLNLRLDQMLLGVALAPSFLGIYAVAVSMAGVAHALGLAAEQVLFPRLAGGTFARARVLVTAGVLALVSLLGAGVLVVAARPLVVALYGNAYSDAASALKVLAFGAVFITAINVLGADAKAHGQLGLLVRAQLVGVGVTAVALIPLVHWWGLVGAATASVASYASTSLVLLLGHLRTRKGSQSRPEQPRRRARRVSEAQ